MKRTTVRDFLDRVENSHKTQAMLDFDDLVNRLIELGICKNDIVLIAIAKEKNFLVFLLALLEIGAVPLPIAVSTPRSRIAELIRFSNCQFFITTKKIRLESNHQSSKIFHYTIIHLNAPSHSFSIPDKSIIILTSGSSGVQKGCVLPVKNILKNAALHAHAVKLGKNDRVLVSLPLIYSYALVAQAFAALVTGAELLINNSPFSPNGYKKIISAFGITSSSLTPFLVKHLFENDKVNVFKPLKTLTVGGDRIDIEEVGTILRHSNNLKLYLTYGLTEAGPRVATLDAHKVSTDKFASVGFPLDTVKVKVTNQHQHAADTGELRVLTETAMSHYLGEGNRSNCKSFDKEGFLKSGDVFRIDEDGYLFFKERKSDLIKVRGELISIAQIRKLIASKNPVKKVSTQISHNSGITSYDLFIHVGETNLSEQKIRTDVRRLLKKAEQPRNIEIIQVSSSIYK